MLAAVVRGARVGAREVRRTLVEMTGVIALAPLLDIFAGALLEARRRDARGGPGVLILIPPFVSQAGALGGILSSRLSSKLQLGVITPRGMPGVARRRRRRDRRRVRSGRLLGDRRRSRSLLADLTGLATGGRAAPGAGAIVAGTVLAGLIVPADHALAGYYLAIVTYRFGLDPDNHSVPDHHER